RYNDFLGQVNMANELLQFRSKELMRRVIDRLRADVSYAVRDGLRRKELYTAAPVRVSFVGAGPEAALALTVTPKNSREAELSDFSRGEKKIMTVHLNDTVGTPLGKLAVFAAENYTPDCFGQP